LLVAGVVVLLFVPYELVGTNLAEEHSQARLAREFTAALARPGADAARGEQTRTAGATSQGSARHRQPRGSGTGKARAVEVAQLPVPPPGGALDHIVIPVIGVNRYVVEGVAENDLQMGPGHYPGTPLPGQRGNVGIAGHRTTFGAPFFRLGQLEPGDLVYITNTAGTTWLYSVQRKWVVDPSDVAVLAPTASPELTLTTCNPPFEATTRLVVRAALVEGLPRGTELPGHLPLSLAVATKGGLTTTARAKASLLAASAPGAGATVPGGQAARAESSYHSPTVGTVGAGPARGSLALSSGGPGTWAAMVAWALLVLACWVATRILAARRRRYAKVLVLLAGSLVCLVPLWFMFGDVVNLLPASI